MLKETSLLLFLVLFSLIFEETSALSCLECDREPCKKPVCCKSGQLTTDQCGCCPICASAEHDTCGGPFGTSGSCPVGMTCFRSCACVTDTEKKCIFPFRFEGVTYYTCTTTKSENNRPWCALEVDENLNVITGRWEDCKDCARSTHDNSGKCFEGDLFNYDGICVRNSVRRQIESIFRNNDVQPVYQFDNGSNRPKPIAQCSQINEFHCHCARTKTKGVRQCLKSDSAPAPLDNGFCFLENVEDPLNPSKNCYPDVKWSQSHGRYWSQVACRLEFDSDNDNISFESVVRAIQN